MGKNISGSNRGVSIEGVPFRVAADANFTETISEFEKEVIATSGRGMTKYTKRVPMRESVVLITNASERESLVAFSDSKEDLKLSYTNAAGDTYQCEGALEIENNETEENRTTCKLLPVNSWTSFINS
jgi:hypothetical protein